MEEVYKPFFELFNDKTDKRFDKKNVVIFGFPRGGTTMVAGVAKLCGLNIGKNLGINLEDEKFNLTDLKKNGLDAKKTIIESIKKNNDSMPIWGWKYPFAGTYLDEIKDYLVSPHLILVSRDPFAIASREISIGKSKIDTIHLILKRQNINIELIQRWKVPTLLISYERALTQPKQFIEALCHFLGLVPPDNIKNIIGFMQPGKYKNINVWRMGKRDRCIAFFKKKYDNLLELIGNKKKS